MIPWSLVDVSQIPGGGGEIKLMQRGAEFSINLGAAVLMNSRASGSETALATLSCERLEGCPNPHVMIGGLGMGFTLRAALAALGPGARVSVAELIPAVVTWARGPLADIFAGSLTDPRVRIVEGDVAALIRAAPASFDAILLDVDNGPEGLTLPRNDGLYGLAGLRAASRALRPGGILSVWSVAPDRAFVHRMRSVGFDVDEIGVRANRGRRGPRHVIWIGRRT